MFDALALAAVADELNATILHGRVQEIIQLDALTFGDVEDGERCNLWS